jgi:aspartate kinase
MRLSFVAGCAPFSEKARGRKGERVSTVLKIGGSVLTGPAGYRQAATFVARLAAGGKRVVVVVSAEKGHTDALLEEARRCTPAPDPELLDLLWSTGEVRSVALLTLLLRASGTSAVGLNAHETGLVADHDRFDLHPDTLLASLTRVSVVVVPGFLATKARRLVTLGRGGSDLSAVVIAARLGAARCVLIKDVDGYYTADPVADPAARLVAGIGYDEALRMADAGCPLVQRDALAAGRDAGVELVVRSVTSEGTLVSRRLDVSSSPVPQLSSSPVSVTIERTNANGLRDSHDSRGTAGRARNRRRRLADLPDHDLSASGAGRTSGV